MGCAVEGEGDLGVHEVAELIVVVVEGLKHSGACSGWRLDRLVLVVRLLTSMKPVEVGRRQRRRRKPWLKWSLYLLAALVFVVGVLVGAIYWELHRSSGEVLTGDQKRTYLLHGPKKIPSDRPMPLQWLARRPVAQCTTNPSPWGSIEVW